MYKEISVSLQTKSVPNYNELAILVYLRESWTISSQIKLGFKWTEGYWELDEWNI